MEENQIDPIPLGSDAQPLLSSDEREIVAQLQQELLDAPNQRIFEFGLRIFVVQIQELEDERISHVRVNGQSLIFGRPGFCATGSLIRKTCNLTIELADRPSTQQCLTLA